MISPGTEKLIIKLGPDFRFVSLVIAADRLGYEIAWPLEGPRGEQAGELYNPLHLVDELLKTTNLFPSKKYQIVESAPSDRLEKIAKGGKSTPCCIDYGALVLAFNETKLPLQNLSHVRTIMFQEVLGAVPRCTLTIRNKHIFVGHGHHLRQSVATRIAHRVVQEITSPFALWHRIVHRLAPGLESLDSKI